MKACLFFLCTTAFAWCMNKAPDEFFEHPEDLLKTLHVDQKIGQLFMAHVQCNLTNDEKQTCECTNSGLVWLNIQNFHIGGVIFLGKTKINKQRELITELQRKSSIPLLVGQDCEWGLGMRISDSICFPHAQTLGAIPLCDEQFIFDLGAKIAYQCHKLGIHMNFAPVVDVNTNPHNPVIGDRSFGQDPHLVAIKACSYYAGLREGGILACTKHFPGHGDSSIDSHDALPEISHSKDRLERVELSPFKALIREKIPAVMVGHLAVPALEPDKKCPASLSRAITHDLLRSTLGFQGLIITDALNMKALDNENKKGEIELQAFKAGADILLCSPCIPEAFGRIKRALREQEITEEDLNQRVLRILTAKQWAYQQSKLYQTMRMPNYRSPVLKYELFARALTLVKNDNNFIPLSQLGIPILQFGDKQNNKFSQMTNIYGNICPYYAPLFKEQAELEQACLSFIEGRAAVLAVYLTHRCGKSKTLVDEKVKACIQALSKKKETVLILFGSPYALAELGDAHKAILVAYENEVASQEAAAKALFGVNPIQGVLPVDATPEFLTGTGILCESLLQQVPIRTSKDEGKEYKRVRHIQEDSKIRKDA